MQGFKGLGWQPQRPSLVSAPDPTLSEVKQLWAWFRNGLGGAAVRSTQKYCTPSSEFPVRESEALNLLVVGSGEEITTGRWQNL